jgi:hypothetical protein
MSRAGASRAGSVRAREGILTRLYPILLTVTNNGGLSASPISRSVCRSSINTFFTHRDETELVFSLNGRY